MTIVDLNSDLGEGFGAWTMGDDLAMLDLVTSANVACGYHAGDPSIMRVMCARAAERGVTIGAHVAYPDLAGFGRRHMDLAFDELADGVLYQVGALEAFARSAGSAVSYVKPHGALAHAIVHDKVQAGAVVAGVRAFRSDLAIMGFPGSTLLRLAGEAGLRPLTEGFPDRAYNPDGTLVARHIAGAVIHDSSVVAARAVQMVKDRQIAAIDGSVVPLNVASLCVHGDTPGAVHIARNIRQALATAAIAVVSCCVIVAE